MYGVIRNLLFRLPPEQAHNIALNGLDAANRLGLLKIFSPKIDALPVNVMGLEFPNPVGLAAGLDKNADHLDALGALGFGFIEVGTVTPVAQPGNPKPRMFRLPEHQAIINRMGFNNEGLSHLLERVDHRRYQGILGINVGKNKDTPNEESEADYRKGIFSVYSRADYITVNVSSPNTPGLRDLQFGDSLKGLLEAIKDEQGKCEREFGRYVPIAVKIAPDMDDDGIRFVADALRQTGLDGVIATNTTISRDAVTGHRHAGETGGLSGAPVRKASLRVIQGLYAELGEALPIIGVGGITDGESAAEKIRAGAKLVQIYTGFIYQGPALIREAVEAIRQLKEEG
ncbi:quinone-dependent dihydroorotate dehydrogenase [Marinobacter sp. M216]|uniref:Dihydroorotate dehydrogenase (quinone) n=1 Tax=Marinobacter albus TaxID=3030833 RepID=A0ABT7HCV4_9GAMM|nr:MULTISPECIES: quinone-dependent dihydroorotate dehydrogenase [unclassified Marinobacter]MBW7469538.1 quinone-dependent dihydroorotate dehydrogenase [Marinobacter sp. F4218]MDK9558193.1 quinone-dependent dihydroorotate dehydrogenase [Marinobacter sp. M216]